MCENPDPRNVEADVAAQHGQPFVDDRRYGVWCRADQRWVTWDQSYADAVGSKSYLDDKPIPCSPHAIVAMDHPSAVGRGD